MVNQLKINMFLSAASSLHGGCTDAGHAASQMSSACTAEAPPADVAGSEFSSVAVFFEKLIALDATDRIYGEIWSRFPDSVRVLLDSKFLSQRPGMTRTASRATQTGRPFRAAATCSARHSRARIRS